MNKRLIVGGVIGAVILGGALVVGANDDSRDKIKIDQPLISQEKVEDIVQNETSGKIEEVELEQENGKLVYEVEIEQEGRGDDDVEVKVEASTGEVVSAKEDTKEKGKVNQELGLVVKDDDVKKGTAVKSNNEEAKKAPVVRFDDDYDDDDRKKVAASPKTNVISREQAIKIAEQAVNGKAYEVERDEDDGRIEYEIELTSNRGEVEVEIDGHTGKILEIDYED